MYTKTFNMFQKHWMDRIFLFTQLCEYTFFTIRILKVGHETF